MIRVSLSHYGGTTVDSDTSELGGIVMLAWYCTSVIGIDYFGIGGCLLDDTEHSRGKLFRRSASLGFYHVADDEFQGTAGGI